MTQYYLLLLLSTLLMSAQFAMNKLYQSKNGSAIKTSLLFTTLSGLFNGAIFFCIGGFRISVTPFSLICAAGIAALCLGYNLIGFRIFELGSFSVYTMFLMLGGMLMPFLYGMIFLGDSSGIGLPALICRLLGVILLTCSLALPCLGHPGSKDKSSRLFIPLCILVFVMNGFVSIISKLHQIEPTAAVDPISFVFLSNTLNGLASGIILLLLCVRDGSKPALAKNFHPWQLILLTVCCGAFNGGSYLLQLIVASSALPASVQYPILTGGSVVLSAIVGRIFFGEKPDKLSLMGIITAFCATFLFLA